MGQEDLKMAGGTQVMVPSNFSSALVLSSTRKSPTALCTTRAREGRSGEAWREGGQRAAKKGRRSKRRQEKVKKREKSLLY